MRRRRPVPGLRGLDEPRVGRPAAPAAGAGVRRGRGDDGGAGPGRDRGAAHAGRLRHGGGAGARVGARARPHLYACTHLANSASLLLPVSNLTNLLAFAASGLAFGRFAALMAVSWLAAIGRE